MSDLRILELNNKPVDENGGCVIYWMQRSQRATYNPALSFAIDLANSLSKPLITYFGFCDSYPMANLRHFSFMLDGLEQTAQQIQDRGIGFVLTRHAPWDGIVQCAKEYKACAVVVDEDYLNIGRKWRSDAAKSLAVRLIQVDSETIVPARLSDHEEYAAYTLRPKITRALSNYLLPFSEIAAEHRSSEWYYPCIDLSSIENTDVKPCHDVQGGYNEAKKRLDDFLENRLGDYPTLSRDYKQDGTSNLSPYLHFGQISSLEIALAVQKSDADGAAVDGFLEQLVVRRELAINFCLYNPNYDSIESAPNWAKQTLMEHSDDPRDVLYSLEELETAQTHSDLWNSAQRQLNQTGKIHGYLRMIWAKKILEWSPSPQEALSRCIYLNDKYALDGRDPNGYTGIAWSIFAKHDRAFKRRPIFGKIRYMRG